MTDFTNTDVVAEYASAVEKVLAVQWTGRNSQALRDLCDDNDKHEYGVRFTDYHGGENSFNASVLITTATGANAWLRVVVGGWVYREQHGERRIRIFSDDDFRAQFSPVAQKLRVKMSTRVTPGAITANDLTHEHINCIVSLAHKVVVVNPDGPSLQQVHDYELDMADYADKLQAHKMRALPEVPPQQPADLPPMHIELPAETTGPLSSYTQTEDTFYLTVATTQIVVDRFDYITIKATPFDMLQPELTVLLNEAAEKTTGKYSQTDPATFADTLPPIHARPGMERATAKAQRATPDRFAPVQRSRDVGKEAGTISWAEHEEAWDGYNKAYRGTGQDAETIARRGGFSYTELQRFLGHDPKTWKANA